MKQYDLGPNGSMIMASDLIASKIDQIENQVSKVNPDYLIVDTPGQMELFAYRTSGPFFIQNINAEDKVNVFLYDATMITSPSNFISISLLAASVKLRLGLPTINVMTKTDLIPDKIDQILKWSSDPISLEESVGKDSDGETYSLTTDILRSLNLGELTENLLPISNATEEGMVNFESALSRVINLGEEVED
jgi:GTPase SAR1 family protein